MSCGTCKSKLKLLTLGFGVLLLSGCATYGMITNTSQTEPSLSSTYSIKNIASKHPVGEVSLVLAFSGGGTRAAALAYGALEELRDTTFMVDGQSRRMLDEVDVISSVSGGSFTSAYYSLNGDATFADFERVFLRAHVDNHLIRGLFNPGRWFSSTGRTEMAIQFYEDNVFQGATFDDMQRNTGPMILINASDLAHGVRFSFVQEYFSLLCSNISSFSVARAVTASSSVPVLFNPVVLANHKGCKTDDQALLMTAEKHAADSPQMTQVIQGLESYFDKDNRHYIHLVDGGITDNLGLRAIYEVIEVAGGASAFLKRINRKPVRRFAIISVNASTGADPDLDLSAKQPTLEDTIKAVTRVQLQRYNSATLELLQHSIKRWAGELSTPDNQIKSYFAQVSFKGVKDPEKRRFFNRIPTRFTLTDEEVDELIIAGHELLRNNPEYQRLITDMGASRQNQPSTP